MRGGAARGLVSRRRSCSRHSLPLAVVPSQRATLRGTIKTRRSCSHAPTTSHALRRHQDRPASITPDCCTRARTHGYRCANLLGLARTDLPPPPPPPFGRSAISRGRVRRVRWFAPVSARGPEPSNRPLAAAHQSLIVEGVAILQYSNHALALASAETLYIRPLLIRSRRSLVR